MRTFLQTEYGSENVVVDNFSKTDMSIDLLVADKEKVINGGYKYNEIIEKIAKNYNAPFIDIYNEFQKISRRKNLIEDLTVDFMHHPTDFGHKVYFSMLLSYFTKEQIDSSRVVNWVLY